MTLPVLFLYILPSHHLNLRNQPLSCTYFAEELTFVAGSFLGKYLDIRQSISSFFQSSHSVPFFVNWSISACWFTSEKAMLFWSDLRCFRLFGEFQDNIEISIKTARVSRLLFCFFQLCLNFLNYLLIFEAGIIF